MILFFTFHIDNFCFWQPRQELKYSFVVLKFISVEKSLRTLNVEWECCIVVEELYIESTLDFDLDLLGVAARGTMTTVGSPVDTVAFMGGIEGSTTLRSTLWSGTGPAPRTVCATLASQPPLPLLLRCRLPEYEMLCAFTPPLHPPFFSSSSYSSSGIPWLFHFFDDFALHFIFFFYSSQVKFSQKHNCHSRKSELQARHLPFHLVPLHLDAHKFITFSFFLISLPSKFSLLFFLIFIPAFDFSAKKTFHEII